MLRKDKITSIREFLNGKQRVDIIVFDDYEEMKDFLKRIKAQSKILHAWVPDTNVGNLRST